MLNNKAKNKTQQARTNSNEAHVGNSWENFISQTNQEAIIMAQGPMNQGSMKKARAKRLQDGFNACLQAKFSAFNEESVLQESLGHPKVIIINEARN